jgi:hypothetical protein
MNLKLRERKWQYYGFLGTLLVAYTVLAKPKSKTLRTLWVSYVVLAALMGIME